MLTTLATFKADLFRTLADLDELAGVQVLYGDADTRRRESIRLRETETIETEQVAFRPGGGRREENYVLKVEVEVGGRREPQDSEARAAELAGVLDDLLQRDPKVGGSRGVIVAWVSAMDLDTGQTAEGPLTRLTVSVSVKARP